MDVLPFVLSYLPPAPARVLEIGCGEGELARAIAGRSYEVIAIDPDAPEGALFRRVRLEEFSPDRRFHAVVAKLSLHHVPDLGAALDKIHSLIEPAGRLVLDEFAWDRLDRETATWLYTMRRTHRFGRGEDQGGYRHGHAHAHADDSSRPPATIDACEQEWNRDHEGLHGFDALRSALEPRFREVHFEWRPYLYRYFDESERERLEEAEREAIEQAAIRAVGFRYVGER